ncbi:MAG: hypothetical protein JGK17_12165 [Microcoleus sp. PH2017_10_PVI_O_A]|uniref:hypothetical protein n=1 Tax=unclassified Microcoleus TaxID=2642155 RepID=UPI001D5524A1|nr:MULTISPECIES: hypothetical protein [unclassified Microcoleus]TAE83155.1 MAG: hypothetical protein EAZ83_09995 [Oscillatoriales cyanobacterium]MCC3406321.1 hypothetical protein [Microcoleus sp. PH2017_10_PVI_O_A]MCC3460305.1 hypothetical protein [Microcoleus sp. PH2017_11_PCY_U_A]MCC3478838.1 hypothetical protein [Microcoleus sp. PH2017_12_PCY_D_A]MCC3528450.1 hypothetical protein [Microcoleus sp. PH2017_21_RUC_O_A]
MQPQSLIPEKTNNFKDEVKESTRYSLEDKRKDLENEVKELTQEMTRLRRINRNWDGGLTISTIVLTLVITLLSTWDRIDEQDKKIATGILGGAIVAIQSIGNAFPVKQRAGAYRILQAQANNLLTDVKYVEGTEELKAIESQFYLLRSDAAKTEG